MSAPRRRIFIATVALMVLFLGIVGIGYAMPQVRDLAQRRTIAAPPAAVQALVVDIETWPDWTAWSRARDPKATWTFSGRAGEAGQRLVWDGPTLGEGEVVITQIHADNGGITFELSLAGMGPSTGRITLSSKDGGTEVEWRDALDLGGHPLVRLIGPWVGSMVADDLETGLDGLAKATE